jgi:PAS domain-containing protein
MHATDDIDSSSSVQTRRTLLTASVLNFLGSGLGISAIVKGSITGGEVAVVLAGGVYGLLALVAILVIRKLPIEKVAAISTKFYTAYLCAGILVSLLRGGNHENLSVYLEWCFTLLVFNELVNVQSVGRFLAKFILFAPLVILGCLFSRVLALFPLGTVYIIVAFCISYLCFGLMLDAVTQYREAYVIEREHASSLRIESEVLDSICDCFISLDREFRLIYLNDAATSEFGVERSASLNRTIRDVIPNFFSESMLAELQVASEGVSATAFESQNAKGLWYDTRCFPQRGRMSIYFRNITESVLSRHQLEVQQF